MPGARFVGVRHRKFMGYKNVVKIDSAKGHGVRAGGDGAQHTRLRILNIALPNPICAALVSALAMSG